MCVHTTWSRTIISSHINDKGASEVACDHLERNVSGADSSLRIVVICCRRNQVLNLSFDLVVKTTGSRWSLQCAKCCSTDVCVMDLGWREWAFFKPPLNLLQIFEHGGDARLCQNVKVHSEACSCEIQQLNFWWEVRNGLPSNQLLAKFQWSSSAFRPTEQDAQSYSLM